MLRLQAEGGWWLVTHPEHARLAGEFASHWGNALFARPEPRAQVLHGIYAHDDGWAARDAQPAVTKQGKPAAFSVELVGTYSAFEEIELASYLAVRREAVQLVAKDDPYAAILISMHTHNLLSARADRSTIKAEHLPLLDAFLVEQRTLQQELRERLAAAGSLPEDVLSMERLQKHFELLQACDNLSLLGCVDYPGRATLLHPFALTDGRVVEVAVEHVGERRFRLLPYPFDADALLFGLQARFVAGEVFETAEALQAAFAAAAVETLEVGVSA
jgi:hypothetical protein